MDGGHGQGHNLPQLVPTLPHPCSSPSPISLFAHLHSAQLSFLSGQCLSSTGSGSRGAIPALCAWVVDMLGCRDIYVLAQFLNQFALMLHDMISK